MVNFYECNNSDCPVSLFKQPKKIKNNPCCPKCLNNDIIEIKYKEGRDEFNCTNQNCPEYQIKPLVNDKGIFYCPFCHSKQIKKIKHDIMYDY